MRQANTPCFFPDGKYIQCTAIQSHREFNRNKSRDLCGLIRTVLKLGYNANTQRYQYIVEQNEPQHNKQPVHKRSTVSVLFRVSSTATKDVDLRNIWEKKEPRMNVTKGEQLISGLASVHRGTILCNIATRT